MSLTEVQGVSYKNSKLIKDFSIVQWKGTDLTSKRIFGKILLKITANFRELVEYSWTYMKKVQKNKFHVKNCHTVLYKVFILNIYTNHSVGKCLLRSYRVIFFKTVSSTAQWIKDPTSIQNEYLKNPPINYYKLPSVSWI